MCFLTPWKLKGLLGSSIAEGYVVQYPDTLKKIASRINMVERLSSF